MTTTTIIWFRRDLRLHDNPAFNWSLAHSDRVVPLYIHDTDPGGQWADGAASRWWLHQSLKQLQQSLAGYGLELQFLSGDTLSLLEQVADDTGAGYLACNRLYEPANLQLEASIEDRLASRLEMKAFHSSVLFVPGSVLNKQAKPYRVYTPFMKSIRPLLDSLIDAEVVKAPPVGQDIAQGVQLKNSLALDKLGLIDTHPWHDKLENYWQPGETRALTLLDNFMEVSAGEYGDKRDFPAIDITSQLSASLHHGEITPRALITRALQAKAEQETEQQAVSVETFIKQIIWREFAHHILYHYPHTTDQPMDERFTDDFWRRDDQALLDWQRGETGVPIVDAGMKQLWQTGWMHNRVRMIVASYLTKNLGIHWLQGARWFWDTLVDADLANNTMGWQWVAGCGVDAAPYYRIFNPLTQAKRFDDQGHYIRRWLHTDDPAVDTQLLDDISVSRQHALERYKRQISAQ